MVSTSLNPGSRRRKRRFGGQFAAPAFLLFLSACATTSYEYPKPVNPEQSYSFQNSSKGELETSVAILTDQEATRHFGADIGKQDVQALWLRIRNKSKSRYWLLRNNVDPDLYSADEVASLVRSEVPDKHFDSLRQHFRDESIRIAQEPGFVTQGFLFLPREEGGRYVEIRLVADSYELAAKNDGHEVSPDLQPLGIRADVSFEFALVLPDGDFDYENLDVDKTYEGQVIPDLDTGALRQTLSDLPCCALDKNGDGEGDPLNIVLIGGATDVMDILSRAGWSFTHRISAHTVSRLISASLEGEAYPVAPVSNLYMFGRAQDIALQRARRNIAQRNHMRLWLAPFTYAGRPVWVGQVSRDIGIKLTTKSPSLTTHVIDPEVDLTREYLLHSLLAEGFVSSFGFVSGSRMASSEHPALNLADDPYFSDGLRLVVELSNRPVPYPEVRSFRWEQSSAPMVEGQSGAAQRNVWPIGEEKP